MNLLSLAGLTEWVVESINSVWMLLCRVVYYFINIFYQVFQTVANINLFSEDVFEKLTGRMYVVIGLVMLFVFAYNLILTIINPEDKKSTSGMVNVVKETIISLVIVILLPLIFNYLFILQEHILSSNIIGTIVFGGVGNSSGVNSNDCDEGDYDCSCDFEAFDFSSFAGNNDIKNVDDAKISLSSACKAYKDLPEYKRGANIIAPTVLSAFFVPSDFTLDECEEALQNGYSGWNDSDNKKLCANYFVDITYSKYVGNINTLTKDSVLADAMINEKMELHSFIAFGAGLIALYIMFCYAMEIGVRVAKLGFLQLISPIPVMLRVIPGQKEKIYAKWFDNLKNTYLDVFIRVAIIYFALFGISLVPDIFYTIFDNIGYGDGNFFIKLVSIALVILGILKFALDAPKLFKELFSLNGNFAVRSPRKQLEENKLLMGGLGAVGAGVTAGVNNFMHGKNGKKLLPGLASGVASGIGGLASGLIRGGRAGYSSNFSNLSNNVSGAVDRTLEARDNRDVRQSESIKYKAKKSWDRVVNWAGGDLSFAALQKQQSYVSTALGHYKTLADEAEKYVDKNKYSLKLRDNNNNEISLAELELKAQRTASEYNNFDRDKWMMANGANDDDADRYIAELRKNAADAQNEFNLARKGLIDAVNNGAGNGGLIHNADAVKYTDSSGVEHKLFDVLDTFGDALKDEKLTSLHTTANNYKENYKNELKQAGLSEADLNGKNKSVKKALENRNSAIDSEMARQREKKSKDGK